MPLSKKELKDIKNKIRVNNPEVVQNIQNRKKVVTSNNTPSSNRGGTKRVFMTNTRRKTKSVVRWNFNVNDLVEVNPNKFISSSRENITFGLIVSDFVFHTERVERNNFFVLVENTVYQLDGKYLRKV